MRHGNLLLSHVLNIKLEVKINKRYQDWKRK